MRVRATALTALFLVAPAREAGAGRPFITDDASVVGRGALQLESWLRFSDGAVEHWVVGAIGPIAPLELSAGASLGLAESDGWEPRLAGAAVQAKILGREPKAGGAPGVACAAGTFTPLPEGAFESNAWMPYTYLAVTEIPFASERLTLYANIGAAFHVADDDMEAGPYWALGASLQIVEHLDVFSEIFAAHPAEDLRLGGTQSGLIVAVNDNVQLDATMGGVVWGDAPPELFGTAGVKLVTNALF
jgi:hypothetical protein